MHEGIFQRRMGIHAARAADFVLQNPANSPMNSRRMRRMALFQRHLSLASKRRIQRVYLSFPRGRDRRTGHGVDKDQYRLRSISYKEHTDEPTVWHHDLTYWPINGPNVVTLWLALDDVTEETGSMEFVKGSHLWGERYHPVAFVDPTNTTRRNRLSRISTIDATNSSSSLRPNQATAQYITGCSCMRQAAIGTTQRRRAYVTRWAGDEVVYDPRPNIQTMLWEPAIDAGAPLDSDLWPVVAITRFRIFMITFGNQPASAAHA